MINTRRGCWKCFKPTGSLASILCEECLIKIKEARVKREQEVAAEIGCLSSSKEFEEQPIHCCGLSIAETYKFNRIARNGMVIRKPEIYS